MSRPRLRGLIPFISQSTRRWLGETLGALKTSKLGFESFNGTVLAFGDSCQLLTQLIIQSLEPFLALIRDMTAIFVVLFIRDAVSNNAKRSAHRRVKRIHESKLAKVADVTRIPVLHASLLRPWPNGHTAIMRSSRPHSHC